MGWATVYTPRVPATSFEAIEAYLARGGQITICEPAYVAPSRQYSWDPSDIVVAEEPEEDVRAWKGIPNSTVVEVLAKGNPHTEGSESYLQYAKYRHGATVNYLRNRAGIKRTRLIRDALAGDIRLEGAILPERKPKLPPKPRTPQPWPGLPAGAVIKPILQQWERHLGTVAHRRWLFYQSGKVTVQSYRDAGWPRGALMRDLGRKVCCIA
jgi:hypothetical protein